ncbi:MAG TPA: HNH endonuclease [bacterium]|nr:HNH endonuclease [bacterium]
MDVLVLNASYEILNITRWQRAVCLIFSGKAEVLEEYDRTISSPSFQLRMPSVIRMNHYIKKPRLRVPLSRNNIFMRDRYTCQYCGQVKSPQELTLDHIVPSSAGGESSWENLVTACKRCNLKKSNRTPEKAGMMLRRKPRAPHFTPSIQIGLRSEWGKYVPYLLPATELESVH